MKKIIAFILIMALTLNCTQGNAMVKGQNNDKSMSKTLLKMLLIQMWKMILQRMSIMQSPMF